jgi:hypothetical protein
MIIFLTCLLFMIIFPKLWIYIIFAVETVFGTNVLVCDGSNFKIILYCSILLHSSIYYNIVTVLSATIIRLKSFKTFLKLQVKS